MRIALVSMNPTWEDKQANMEVCKGQIEVACGTGVDLIIFPEMTLTGFSVKNSELPEKIEESNSLKFFSAIAAKYSVNIIFGISLLSENGNSNSAICINRQGDNIGQYSKIHTFSFAEESQYYVSGTEITTVEIEGIKFGITICFDLRFPELYSALSEDSQVLINIANWPTQRSSHWKTLLQARAIENQCLVIGVNRIGADPNGNCYERNSNIIAPDGETIEPIISIAELDVYNIDASIVDSYRSTFGTRIDRRPKIYSKFYEKR